MDETSPKSPTSTELLILADWFFIDLDVPDDERERTSDKNLILTHRSRGCKTGSRIIELQVKEEVDFDYILLSISFQMTGGKDAEVQGIWQISHGTSGCNSC